MNAVAHAPAPPAAPKRCCYKCGQRWPVASMKVKRTPSGGAIYTCPSCAKPAKAVR